MISSFQSIARRKKLPRAGQVILGALLAQYAWCASDQQPEITLSLNDQLIEAEVAYTEAARMHGLAHHQMLPENRGMLFAFRQPGLYGMWMRNTSIPLSVAFLDEQGVIINIAVMEPNTSTRHFPDRPAKYALEVNRGWFAARGIKTGMQVAGIKHAPPAE